MNNNIALNPNVTNIKQCKKKKKSIPTAAEKLTRKFPRQTAAAAISWNPKDQQLTKKRPIASCFPLLMGFSLICEGSPTKNKKITVSRKIPN